MKKAKDFEEAEIFIQEDGTVVSVKFNDIYSSKAGVLEEARYVFLEGSGFIKCVLEAQKKEINIFEVGFGCSVNFYSCFDFIRNKDVKVNFYSIEKYPIKLCDMQLILKNFDYSIDESKKFLDFWGNLELGYNVLELSNIKLILILDDINNFVNDDFEDKIDFWFLDGFSPSNNKDMWQEKLFEFMSLNSNMNACFSTYTASSFVKKNMEKYNFSIKKQKGFGFKREMMCGYINL